MTETAITVKPSRSPLCPELGRTSKKKGKVLAGTATTFKTVMKAVLPFLVPRLLATDKGPKDRQNNHSHLIGNGPNTVSESTVSNTELSEFFGAH